MGGHGTALGGVIVEGGSFDWEASGKFPGSWSRIPATTASALRKRRTGSSCDEKIRAVLLRDTGATLAPAACFLLLQGLETLSLRVNATF